MSTDTIRAAAPMTGCLSLDLPATRAAHAGRSDCTQPNHFEGHVMQSFRIHTLFLIFVVAIAALGSLRPAFAAQSREQEAKATLNALYETSPAAKVLGAEAKAILVFPEIRKGGFIFGGQFGQGVLLKN